MMPLIDELMGILGTGSLPPRTMPLTQSEIEASACRKHRLNLITEAVSSN